LWRQEEDGCRSKKGIEAENHRVTLAFDGHTGFDLALTMEFDIVALDLMLPVIEGFKVARRLRKNDNRTPILMLTARDAVPDVVEGLHLGADDYLTKPISFEVFLARLRLARRGSAPPADGLQIGDLVLNPASRQVTAWRTGNSSHPERVSAIGGRANVCIELWSDILFEKVKH
jgi:DNA-binding response OmpR family regulator